MTICFRFGSFALMIILPNFIMSRHNEIQTITGFEAVGQVDPRFLSVAIDSHLIAERWKHFDFR